MMKMFQSLGFDFDPKEMLEFFNSIDTNRDSKINLQEFY
jgi:Ca2+-binding EF-hand superfamily protein